MEALKGLKVNTFVILAAPEAPEQSPFVEAFQKCFLNMFQVVLGRELK